MRSARPRVHYSTRGGQEGFLQLYRLLSNCAHFYIFNVKSPLYYYFLITESSEYNDIQLDISKLYLMDYLFELCVYFAVILPSLFFFVCLF